MASAEIQFDTRNFEQQPLSIEDRLGIIQRRYAGEGNIINYATTLLEGSLRGLEEESEIETIENLSTHIIEQVLADANLPYYYQLQPEGDRIKSSFGYLDEMIQTGINNSSKQAFEFEIPRFERNAQFLSQLVEYKKLAMQGREDLVAVEFSPAPEATSEALARGYNHDTFSISTWNPETGQLEVKQLWFDCIRNPEGRQSYQDLFRDLQVDDVTISGALDVMDKSGIFTVDQLRTIENFVQKQGGLLSDLEIRGDSSIYQTEVLVPAILHKLLLPLREIRHQLQLEFWNPEASQVDSSIPAKLNDIAQQIRLMQLQYRIWMRDNFGINTISEHVAKRLKEIGFETILDSDTQTTQMLLDQIGYQAAACGSQIGKNSMSIIDSDKTVVEDKSESEFICTNCGHKHDITPLGGGLRSRCDSCGTLIPKCEG